MPSNKNDAGAVHAFNQCKKIENKINNTKLVDVGKCNGRRLSYWLSTCYSVWHTFYTLIQLIPFITRPD